MTRFARGEMVFSSPCCLLPASGYLFTLISVEREELKANQDSLLWAKHLVYLSRIYFDKKTASGSVIDAFSFSFALMCVFLRVVRFNKSCLFFFFLIGGEYVACLIETCANAMILQKV